MHKKIVLAILIFAILLILPVLWHKNIKFDLAEFTKEYYKYLFEMLLVGVLVLFFEHQSESIKKYYTHSTNKEKIIDSINCILNEKEEIVYSSFKEEWDNLLRNESINFFLMIDDINKIKVFVTNTNEINFKDKIASNDYRNILSTLKLAIKT